MPPLDELPPPRCRSLLLLLLRLRLCLARPRPRSRLLERPLLRLRLRSLPRLRLRLRLLLRSLPLEPPRRAPCAASCHFRHSRLRLRLRALRPAPRPRLALRLRSRARCRAVCCLRAHTGHPVSIAIAPLPWRRAPGDAVACAASGRHVSARHSRGEQGLQGAGGGEVLRALQGGVGHVGQRVHNVVVVVPARTQQHTPPCAQEARCVPSSLRVARATSLATRGRPNRPHGASRAPRKSLPHAHRCAVLGCGEAAPPGKGRGRERSPGEGLAVDARALPAGQQLQKALPPPVPVPAPGRREEEDRKPGAF